MGKRVSEDNLSKLQKTWRKERESIAGKKKKVQSMEKNCRQGETLLPAPA
jgi:hypothetical protein